MRALKTLFIALFGFCTSVHADSTDNSFIFLLDVELLYWKAHEGHLQFANLSQPIDSTNNFTTSSLVKPDFDWDFGFRACFGYASPETKWDCLARFTYIENTASGSYNTGTVLEEIDSSSVAFFPVLSRQSNLNQGDYVFGSSMNWRSLLNIYDLYSGYHFQLIKWFEITPYFGLRGIRVNQSLNANYSGGIFATGTDQLSMKNNYWGIGPYISVCPEFIVYKGLSIPLSVGTSSLLGQLSLEQNERYFSTTLFSYNDSSFRLRWILDASAALKYAFTVFQGRYEVAFSAGWEYHLFFNQNSLPQNQFALLKGSRDLSFSGAFFSALLRF